MFSELKLIQKLKIYLHSTIYRQSMNNSNLATPLIKKWAAKRLLNYKMSVVHIKNM